MKVGAVPADPCWKEDEGVRWLVVLHMAAVANFGLVSIVT